MIQLIVKIPVIENGSWVFDGGDDRNDRVLIVHKELISSGPLPKEKVEIAFVQLFVAFCDFFLQHDLPIAPEYKVSLQERRVNL